MVFIYPKQQLSILLKINIKKRCSFRDPEISRITHIEYISKKNMREHLNLSKCLAPLNDSDNNVDGNSNNKIQK